jgi:rhodanese-related sulfurtransferase
MKSITAKALKQLLVAAPTTVLIDVREPYENEVFNIGGTLIPLGDIMQHAAAIPTHVPVVVYCKKGIRSAIAIQRLQAKYGMENLINLQGGLSNWEADL